MKAKILIYPFCGCFLTSAAVALTLYGDLGYCGYDVCLNDPGAGKCCAPENRVTKLNIAKSSSSKITGGLFMVDDDGQSHMVVDPYGEFDFSGLKYTLRSNTSKVATLKEYNSGTKFETFVYDENGQPDGDIVETDQPPRAGTVCDEVEIVLVECNGYPSNYQGQTVWIPGAYGCTYSATRSIYYKENFGYFRWTPNGSSCQTKYDPACQYKDETHPNAPLTLEPPTPLAGHTFRGYFPSWWSSAITGTSSYIGPWTPYRTEGHAYRIAWKDSSMDRLWIEKPEWVVSTNSSSSSACGRLYMFAGWAKNCEDPEHCYVVISGHDNEEMRPVIEKSDLWGRWLPGAVEYKWRDHTECASDQYPVPEGTITLTRAYPYDPHDDPGENGQLIEHHLNTYHLGCATYTLSAGDAVSIDYNENWSNSGAPFQCESVSNTTCNWGSPLQITSAKPNCHTAGTNDGKYEFNSWIYANGFYVNSASASQYVCNATYIGTPAYDGANWNATGLKAFACLKNPGAGYGAQNITLDASQARYCKYTVQCRENYHCANNNCTKTCRDGAGDSQYSSCTNFNLEDVCVEDQVSEFMCPATGSIAGVNVTGGNQLSSNGTCEYTASCSDTTKECQSSVNTIHSMIGREDDLCIPQTCNGESSCAALAALYTASNILCTGGEPASDYSGVIHLEM